jgi:hypothetical protein
LCEKTFVKYACGHEGRRLDRKKCENMKQVDKLLKQGFPIYVRAIIKLEKICETCYTFASYSELERECGKYQRAERDAQKLKNRMARHDVLLGNGQESSLSGVYIVD